MMVQHCLLRHRLLTSLTQKWNLLNASGTASTSSRNFCDQGNDKSNNTDVKKYQEAFVPMSFKDQMIKKHLFPSEERASALKELFPDPKKVVDDLFAPFLKVEDKLIPTISVKRHLRDSICKTHLHFQWPASTDVCGVHTDEDKAVENAYLTACELFLGMGLIEKTETGTRAYSTEHVIKILEDFAAKQTNIGYETNNFRVINLLLHNQDDIISWRSSLQVYWPVCFTVSSQSACLDLAYYQSCLKAAMKFKAFGYLDEKNQLKQSLLLALVQYDPRNSEIHVRHLSDPDYEIFVDASAVGMGAYLISKDEERIRWISDRWIQSRIKFDPRSDSNLCEFYALVTALYTWKHKFVDKKVLCYCDNLFVINAINSGVYTPKVSRRSRSYESLFMLAMKVCHKYNITVVGVHVPRLKNIAADLLSRCDVDSFKKIVPTAYENPKKSKKLWFCSFNSHLEEKDKKEHLEEKDQKENKKDGNDDDDKKKSS